MPVIVWAGMICWMSTETFSSVQSSRFIMPLIDYLLPWLSPQGADLMHWMIRKAGHLVVYFIFGLLLFRAFCGDSTQRWSLRLAVYSVITLISFAMIDEFHQSFVPARTSLLSDVAIDTAGGVFSQVAIAIRAARKRSGIAS